MSKEIPLTQGKVALVDDHNFSLLNCHKWFAQKIRNDYYAVRKSTLGGKQINVLMHRELLQLEYGDKRQGDHIDHQTLNNCESNLRIATNAQNSYNQIACEGTSIFKGVDYHKLTKKWRSRIMVDGLHKHLGLFMNEIDAAKVYDKAALAAFGVFAYLNFDKKGG